MKHFSSKPSPSPSSHAFYPFSHAVIARKLAVADVVHVVLIDKLVTPSPPVRLAPCAAFGRVDFGRLHVARAWIEAALFSRPASPDKTLPAMDHHSGSRELSREKLSIHLRQPLCFREALNESSTLTKKSALASSQCRPRDATKSRRRRPRGTALIGCHALRHTHSCPRLPALPPPSAPARCGIR